MSNNEYKNYSTTEALLHFKNFAQTIKLPLHQMARAIETANITGDTAALQTSLSASESLTSIINSYILSLDLQLQADGVQLQPISLGAVLSEVAHVLSPAAAQQGYDVELCIDGKFEPVMAHHEAVIAAMTNIGQALIDARSVVSTSRRPIIRLAVHRTGHGIVGGIFTDLDGINAANLRRARQLKGVALQPLNQLLSSGAGGVMIADVLLAAMSGGLRSARFQKLQGLAATFTPSQQLALYHEG